ncbi:hypothetical protein PACTADRAFT_48544 [Pachysolen tannophilus NRRL Y-2460]|uniref:Peroxisomal targeting signal receptor n=1 Tax=Pachysolen tannophilus NRRL Y-2460 TaxID=669874 RepID=A0A1E4TYA6_PACTA|nr:hypothetical protein PACTADRAFT_48544 [Pachysolen tannophilus NRRL Y-2460]
MSFSGGGAECSTSSNPLAQFSKQANVDRSLQQSVINRSNGNIIGNGGIRKENAMNPVERQNFENFLQRNQNNNNAFNNFQPMSHELNIIQNQNGSRNAMMDQNNKWKQDFRAVTSVNNNQVDANIYGTQLPSESRWVNEFGSSSKSMNNNKYEVTDGMGYSSGFGVDCYPRMNVMARPTMMGNGFMNGGSSAQQFHVQDEKIVELDSNKWEDQFNEIEREQEKEKEKENEEDIVIDDKYKATFEEVWDGLNQDFENGELLNQEYESMWERDFSTYASGRLNYSEYKLEENNPFINENDPYTIGIRLMENGARLSEAALAFEAAVRQNDKHVEAWLKLGEVQTQNEKESAGISALEKCIELDPGNLKALMTLAISYVNEGYDNAAYATLERWIDTKYPQVTSKARLEKPSINDDDRFSLNNRITELFLKAAQLSPDVANMDADVQTGLGVLFYSMEEFEKTLDCFKAAISVNANDSLMWNRLGACLANSNRSEEAIEAYSRALQLNPNFVRARYNLGVSCINMGLYKEAAEHLLGGLSMHNVEGSTFDNGNNNNTIGSNQSVSLLETLKRAFLAMDRRDLIDKVKPGMNLDQFRDEFNF